MQVWYQRFGYTIGLGTLDPEDEYRREKKAIDTKWYVAFVASRPHGSTHVAAGKKETVENHSPRIERNKKGQAVVCFKRDSCVVVLLSSS